jgi:hypothetical protein
MFGVRRIIKQTSHVRSEMMETPVVTIQLPANLYAELQALAAQEQTDPAEMIARLVARARQDGATMPDQDPVFELIGAYRSDQPLIDDIPVSEDPELYVIAAQWGARAAIMHAWELAPKRYRQGPDGRPIRLQASGE